MSLIYLRRTYMHDLPAIKQIIAEAKQALKDAGSPQWQDGHPNNIMIVNDIVHHLSWALVVDNKIVGVATLQADPEESYKDITDGEWHNDDDRYMTIHRVAISNEYRGKHLSDFLFTNLLSIGQERGYHNFRIDTHEKNTAMRAVLKKFGFEYRGIVNVKDWIDTKRMAFELNLPTHSLPVEHHVDNNFMKPIIKKGDK
ncbi:MAG: GNAT family N-acetyltransferase [Limosilactobacillus sp.]|uniref:GNAT family N-acetyltransferase n=1 Tax=Limosilactobacillus sp. TaxID=2773925 RepID=UPI0026FFFE5F|nr:GNAT family N-acetyltransferase [Limosilactobacillus sp.]